MGIAIRLGNAVFSVQVWYWDPDRACPYWLVVSWQRLNKPTNYLRLGEIHDHMGRRRTWSNGGSYR